MISYAAFVRIQHQVDRGITDGVGGDPPAGAVGGNDRVDQGVRVVLQIAADTRLIAEIRTHGGGVPDQGSVGEDLHRPQAQAVIAEPGAKSQVDAVAEVVGLGATQCMQHRRHHHEFDAHGQAPGIAARW